MEFIDPIFLIILGMTVGIYAGAIGAGGGFLIAPILLLRHPYATPTEITAAALIYVVINSAIQVSLAIREQKIDTQLILTLAIIGIPAAILGGLTTELIERVYFSFGFGIFLVLVGIYIMLRPTMISDRMPSQGWSRNIKDRQGNLYNYTVPVARSGIAQAATAFFSALALTSLPIFSFVPLILISTKSLIICSTSLPTYPTSVNLVASTFTK